MKKIALVLPYFGKFKNYFPLWVNSCRNNPTIDWFIYTDQSFDFLLPANIFVKKISFNQFKEKLQNIFDFTICLDKPYKLCDFKPTYGLALKEELKNYDFWGYCDCDLIFGDIRKFVTEEILNKYDKLFTRGHFSLYKNTEEVNSFFKKQQYHDYKEVLQSPKSFAFDEWGGVSKFWDLSGQPYYDDLVYDDIRGNLDGFHTTKENSGWGNPYHRYNDISQAKNFRQMKNIIYSYEQGKLYRVYNYKSTIQQQEILYVHFKKRNMNIDANLNTTKFFIVPNAFKIPYDLAIANLKFLSPNRMTTKNMVSYFKQIIHSILKK